MSSVIPQKGRVLHVQLFVTPRIGAPQAPLPMGFSRQEYSGFPFPFSGDLPNPGVKPRSQKPVCDAADLGLIPGLGRPPGEGNGNPL